MLIYYAYKIIGYNLIGGNQFFRQCLSLLFVLLEVIMAGRDVPI